jgi:hypothetical protein
MDYAQLQAEIAKADAAYAAASAPRAMGQSGMLATVGQDTAGMQAAVAAREAAVRAYNSSQSSAQPPSPTTQPTPPPPPAPVLPQYKPANITSRNFKVAPTDIIQFDDNSIEIALISDLLFEDIGATELANMSRSDLIDGQDVVYAPIKNLPTVRREFNPNNIVATSYETDYFSRFAIDLSLRGIQEPYFDDNGDLVIEIDTVEDSEEIQVQILTNGTIDLVEIL